MIPQRNNPPAVQSATDAPLETGPALGEALESEHLVGASAFIRRSARAASARLALVEQGQAGIAADQLELRRSLIALRRMRDRGC